MRENHVQRRLRERFSSTERAQGQPPPFPGFTREQLDWLAQSYPHMIFHSGQFRGLEHYWQHQGAASAIDDLCRLQDAFERERAEGAEINPLHEPDAERVP